jgi:hypothetical protein
MPYWVWLTNIATLTLKTGTLLGDDLFNERLALE